MWGKEGRKFLREGHTLWPIIPRNKLLSKITPEFRDPNVVDSPDLLRIGKRGA